MKGKPFVKGHKPWNTGIRLYLGCAMPPFHGQHHAVMGDVNEWTWVDLYVDHPNVKKWDVTKLTEVEDGSCESIYASHLLEHIEHINLTEVLSLWKSKLKTGGRLILNVPDLIWALKAIEKLENGEQLVGYYKEFFGVHGILSILYGSQSHAGEYHKSGFTKRSMEQLLQSVGFTEISVKRFFDAHDMGVVFVEATA